MGVLFCPARCTLGVTGGRRDSYVPEPGYFGPRETAPQQLASAACSQQASRPASRPASLQQDALYSLAGHAAVAADERSLPAVHELSRWHTGPAVDLHVSQRDSRCVQQDAYTAGSRPSARLSPLGSADPSYGSIAHRSPAISLIARRSRKKIRFCYLGRPTAAPQPSWAPGRRPLD